MITEIQALLECLIDEVKYGGNNPSEWTVKVLSRCQSPPTEVRGIRAEYVS